MQEESKSFNETEGISPDMIFMPQNSHVEVLISDDEPMDNESHLEYEKNLSNKLKDLGFEDEGMTLQQKEELFAVVIASWETAQEEKSRRRIYEEYSGALTQDSIQLPTKLSPKYESTIMQTDSSHNFTSQIPIFSPLEVCETETIITKFPYESPHCSSTSSHDRKKSECADHKRKFKREHKSLQKGKSLKINSDIIRSKPDDTKLKNLEKSATLWRPKRLPKEHELSCSRRPTNVKKERLLFMTADDYSRSIANFAEDFDFTMLTLGKTHNLSQFSTSYHLSRHNNFSKRPNRADKFDTLVGMSEKEDAEVPSLIQKIEPLKKSGAFRNFGRDEISTMAPSDTRITRSGVQYGLERKTFFKKEIQMKSQAEDRTGSRDSPNITDNEVEVILDERLPRFTNIRPKRRFQSNDPGRSISAELCTYPSTSKSSCSAQEPKKDIHTVNSSTRDSDSSEGSVIDVETIVDDEIDDFVQKRKRIQENHFVNKQSKTNRAKRLKKNAY